MARAGLQFRFEFSNFLSESLKWFAPLLQYANVRRTTDGRSVKVCRVDDSLHGLSLVAEGNTLSEVDPTFSSNVVSADPLSSGLVRYSNQLLSDSAFDLERLLTDLTSSRIGRGVEKAIVLGKDVSNVTLPNNPGLVSLANVASTTTAIAAGVGWTDLVNVFDALDAAYANRAVWLMNSKTRNYLASAKDSTSRSYFVPGTQSSLDMLLGRPIVITQSLPLITIANSTPIILADLYSGLQVIVSEPRVAILRERFAEFNESSLGTSLRLGSVGLQTGANGAIQALKIAAS